MGYRIIGIDVGKLNMGFASAIVEDGKLVIERLDRRGLNLRAKNVSELEMIDAIIEYVRELIANDDYHNVIFIEQTKGGRTGINVHAKVIEVTVITTIKLTYRNSEIYPKSPVARKGETRDQKERARERTFSYLDSHDAKWSEFLHGEDDPQHICDAFCFILDKMGL